MKLTRRDFVSATAAFAAVPGFCGNGAGKPLMRLGIISDLHVLTRETGMGLQNCLCYEPALRYFDER